MKLWLLRFGLCFLWMLRDPYDLDLARRLVRRIDACDRLRSRRRP